MDNRSFDDLLGRLDRHERSAATEIFERFAERLMALARNRLSPPLRQKIDPEDVAQSVFRSFFQRQEAGKLQLDDWGGLWGLLVTMTVRKCGRRAEEFYAARRDIRREVPRMSDGEDSVVHFEPADVEPTPSEAAVLNEIVENLMESLDGRGREILALRLQGYSVAEISSRVERTERTVHRVLDTIKARLQKLARQ